MIFHIRPPPPLMFQFFDTSVNANHKHVAVLSDDLTGIAVGGDHQHVIAFDESIGQWSILESEMHSHALADRIVFEEDDLKKMDEEDVVKEVTELYKQAYDGESKMKKLAKEARDFVNNEQWDESERTALESDNRACLTINITKTIVDMLKGYQRKNRTDPKLTPKEGGDENVANIGTKIIKHILESSNFVFEESAAFDDQVVEGRGFLTAYIDYDKNIRGDIIVERVPASKVTVGPHCKMDMSDAEYLFKEDLYSRDKLKQIYPTKEEKIGDCFDQIGSDVFPDPHIVYKGEQYERGGKEVPGPSYGFIDGKKKNIKMLECWRKHFEKSYVAVSEDGSTVERVSKAVSKMIAKHPQFRIIERNTHRMRVTKIAGNVLLEDEFSEDHDDFDIVVAYCYKDDDMWYGKVETAKDAQRELNHRRSQYIDILNKACAYGWLIDKDTFGGDDAMKDAFRREASSPGFILEVDDLRTNKPERIDGVRVPTELVTMDQMSQQTIYSLFNVPMEPQGQSQPDVSAKAILARQRQGLVANEFLWDNGKLAKKNLIRKILKLIPKVYKGDRIVRLIDNNGDAQARGPEIEKIIEGKDWVEYDVQISETLYTETVRQANFDMWMEARNNGFPVPPQTLFELSDLPEKEKVMAQFEQQEQGRSQAEAQKNNAETQKSKPKELQLMEAGIPIELAFGLQPRGGA